jgi:hypothetical protein
MVHCKQKTKNKQQQQTPNSALLDSLYGGAEAFWPVPTWAARLYHSLHSVAIYNSGNHRSPPLEVPCYLIYKDHPPAFLFYYSNARKIEIE